MKHPFNFVRKLVLLMIAGPAVASIADRAQEVRGLWVDGFHPGLRSPTEVRQLVSDARAGHFNALFVEVRRRGDAFYNSRYEPKAADVTPAGFDPLGELIALAHDTNSGPRLEVHAWIVTYNIWNELRSLPRQAGHPYLIHRDWLTRTDRGVTWDGSNFAFDPGHPDVQRHTFNVAMDIIERYDVDGLQFDYVRYAGTEWGYNDVAVARFKKIFNRTRLPLQLDPQWLQFRRDQVTALVRKTYLSAIATRPEIKISAATITWAPGITVDEDWPRSAAYSTVLQDWRAWMQEGILDLNVPMVYFRQQTVNSNDWDSWTLFAKDHRYQRQVAIGAALYLNNLSRSLGQLRSTRVATASGNQADGVVLYSYATPGNDRTARSEFLRSLTGTGRQGPNSTPLYAAPIGLPEMLWKTAPTLGHLKGVVTCSSNAMPADAAIVTLAGPVNRTCVVDATGFYGSVDLPPGSYTVSVNHANSQAAVAEIAIVAGAVATQDLTLTTAVSGTDLPNHVTNTNRPLQFP